MSASQQARNKDLALMLENERSITKGLRAELSEAKEQLGRYEVRMIGKIAEIERLTEEKRAMAKMIAAECADPNGTIWDHAKNLQDEVDRLRKLLDGSCEETAEQFRLNMVLLARAVKAEAEVERLQVLLDLYREKRKWDGLNGRPWSAIRHMLAEDRIIAIESAAGAGREMPRRASALWPRSSD